MDYDPQPGMLVACINDDWPIGESPLTRGRVYEVAAVGVMLGLSIGPTSIGMDQVAIQLVGVTHPQQEKATRNGDFVGFDPLRFRPVRDDALDVFREALNKAPVRRKEPA